MIGKAKLAHQAAFPTISGKAIAGRETEKGEIIVSKEEENETKKEPPNCSFQRTRIPATQLKRRPRRAAELGVRSLLSLFVKEKTLLQKYE